MRPPLPRLLLMCLALAFASVWLGCGPEELEDGWAPELSGSELDVEANEEPEVAEASDEVCGH